MGLVIVDKAMSALLLALAVPRRTVLTIASRIHGLLNGTVVVFVADVYL